MQAENADLQLVKNPNTNKVFFVCGNTKGYVSPKALDKLNHGGTVADFQYAEVSIDGGEAVPCLMVVGSGNANVIKTLSLD